MKFLVTKELKENTPLKQLVGILVVVLIFFLLLDVLLHHYQIGFTLSDATATILGDMEAFVEPVLFDMLLERVHIDTLTALISLMLLALIYIRVSSTPNRWLLHIGFTSAIATQLTLLGSFWLGEVAIVLWITSFMLWHFIALFFAVLTLWRLYAKE